MKHCYKMILHWQPIPCCVHSRCSAGLDGHREQGITKRSTRYTICLCMAKTLITIISLDESFLFTKMNLQWQPLLFYVHYRCSAGLDGLREQGITNIIVRTLIEEYDTIFKSDVKDESSSPPSSTSVGSKCIQVQATTSKRSPPVKPAPYHDYVRQKEERRRVKH